MSDLARAVATAELEIVKLPPLPISRGPSWMYGDKFSL